MILKGYIFTFLYVIFVSFITLSLNRVFKIRTIITRKFTHIMASLVWVIMYFCFGTSIHMIIPPLFFMLAIFIAYKYKLITFFLDDGDFLGIVYYFTSFFMLALISYFYNDFYMAYGIGILCMGLGDGFAPLVAGYLRIKEIINNKSLMGSLTVFIMAMFVVVNFNYFLNTNFNFFEILMIGASTALLELFGANGKDNLYLPIGVALISYLLGVI